MRAGSTGMASTETHAVTKRFGNRLRAVDDISLTMGVGELVVLVGPSGFRYVEPSRLFAGNGSGVAKGAPMRVVLTTHRDRVRCLELDRT
jgi:alpha-D-ribose 1-methylphosphonate 5-triphosphate synthase subunit PhnL